MQFRVFSHAIATLTAPRPLPFQKYHCRALQCKREINDNRCQTVARVHSRPTQFFHNMKNDSKSPPPIANMIDDCEKEIPFRMPRDEHRSHSGSVLIGATRFCIHMAMAIHNTYLHALRTAHNKHIFIYIRPTDKYHIYAYVVCGAWENRIIHSICYIYDAYRIHRFWMVKLDIYYVAQHNARRCLHEHCLLLRMAHAAQSNLLIFTDWWFCCLFITLSIIYYSIIVYAVLLHDAWEHWGTLVPKKIAPILLGAAAIDNFFFISSNISVKERGKICLCHRRFKVTVFWLSLLRQLSEISH